MRVLSFLTISTLMVIVVSCGGGGGGNPVTPPPPDKTIQWTVMLYMGADNNLAPVALADLNELEQVGSTDKVKFTALADVYYRDWDQYGAPIFDLVDKDGKPVTPMMNITKHPEDEVQSHLSDASAVLYPNDGFNSADPANLTSFIKWSKQRFPAKHYALIIWDHGSSWTAGRTGSAAVVDQTSGCAEMYVHEIEQAIKNSGVHFDLLDFTACNMADAEVAYQLKDVTNYICGSQRVMWLGTDGVFQVVAQHLTSNPGIGPTDLGKTFVDAYVQAWTQEGHHTITQSLIRCDKIAAVAGAVSQLTPLLADPKIISSEELRKAFHEPVRFFQDADLLNFADVLPYHTQNQAVASALAGVKTAVASAVVYSQGFTSPDEESSWTFGSREFGAGEDIDIAGAAGLNIFLPTEIDWTDHNFSYYSSIGFAQASGWNWVIAYAYNGIPYLGTAPGNWLAELVWSTGVDLDLWVFEPDGYGGVIPASPCLGPQSTNGILSSDSRWTGIPAEAYEAKPEVIWGPYFFLAVYYGPNLFSNDAYCMLGIFASPTDADPAITTNAYYISAALPNDPDFGPGVVYFGFALYIPDDDTWYFFEGDRTGESVSSDQVSNIRGQMQSIVPSAGDSKMRRPAGLDQNTIDQYNAQGMALAQRLRDSTGSPNEEAASDSGWARVH